MIKKILDLALDRYADKIAPCMFFVGAIAMAFILALFHGLMIILYLAIFVTAGLSTLGIFILLVTKYRDHKDHKYRDLKYHEETKGIDEYNGALDAVKKGTADDLSNEQITMLVKRSRKN